MMFACFRPDLLFLFTHVLLIGWYRMILCTGKIENIDIFVCFVLILLFVWICASSFLDVSRSMRCSLLLVGRGMSLTIFSSHQQEKLQISLGTPSRSKFVLRSRSMRSSLKWFSIDSLRSNLFWDSWFARYFFFHLSCVVSSSVVSILQPIWFCHEDRGSP